MPISTKDSPDTLPPAAKKVYAAAFNASYNGTCRKSEDRDACAAKIAWSAVKKGYEKKDGKWFPKPKANYDSVTEFSMYIDKAIYNKETQELRWHCVASDTDVDSYEDNMTLELFGKFLSRIESSEAPPEKYRSEFWSGGMPYLSISHYSDQNGKGVPGVIESVYVDGEKLKGKGTFHKTPLGMACFDAINEDKHGIRKSDNPELDHPVRISIAFLDYAHKHRSNGEIFIREDIDDICPHCILEAITGEGEGKEYLDGHLIHFALTRVPVNKRTEMEVSKSMATRKDDSSSIVGEELAEELEQGEQAFKSEALVTMSEEETPEAPEEIEENVEKMEHGENKAKNKKKDMKDDEEEDDEEMEEKSEVSRHILQDTFDAYRSAFDEVLAADLTMEEKLKSMQPVLEQLAQTTRSAIEGVPQTPISENREIAELKSMVAQLSQSVQLLSQQIQDKSNVQDVQVPAVRSFQPDPMQVQNPVTAQPHDGSLHSIIRSSVGLRS